MLDQPLIRLATHCSLQVERDAGTATIRLAGEFDLACEERFQEELNGILDGVIKTLVLDLRGLDFIDSTGLRTLLRVDAAAHSDGFDLMVLCSDGHVRRMLRETGLDGVLEVADRSDAAPPADGPG